jgi:hypothetical protein
MSIALLREIVTPALKIYIMFLDFLDGFTKWTICVIPKLSERSVHSVDKLYYDEF